jgi:hypothetical protein
VDSETVLSCSVLKARRCRRVRRAEPELTSDTLVGKVGEAAVWLQVSFGQRGNVIETDACTGTEEFPDMFSPYVV